MTFASAISHFAESAQAYCSWLESAPGSAAAERYAATRLVAELFAAALSLPGTDPVGNEPPEVTPEQRRVIQERLRGFPFQYYWETFHPVTETPEEPVCGDIVDDLLDIYVDVKEGLLVFPKNEQGAVFHWGFTFGVHWGRHATSALRALHAFDPDGEKDAEVDE